MRFQRLKSFLSSRVRPIAVAGFFVSALIIGLMAGGGYGASYDDQNNQSFGDRTLGVYLNALGGDFDACADGYCADQHDQIHGPLFETVISAAQKMSASIDPWDLLQIRHLMVFLFFFVGLCFFYRLCLLCLGDWRLALLGSAFLFLSPRILADSFYNSVDIGALSAMIIASYSLAVLAKSDGRSARRALVHAAVSAASIAIRSVTIIVPLATVVWYAHRMIAAGAGMRRKIAGRLGIYLAATAFFTVCLTPTLWRSPIAIIQHLGLTTHFPTGSFSLYLGSVIEATDLPWHFNLVWIAITTPPLYLALFLVGIAVSANSLARAAKQRRMSFYSGAQLLALSVFFGPILMVVAFHTALYNGWRHLFFIYPALIFIALVGLSVIVRKTPPGLAKKAVFSAIAAALAITAGTMIRIYPYEYLYFNSLYQRDVQAPDFDTDYWSLSYRNALLRLLATDDSPVITVSFSDGPRNRNVTTMLSQTERSRIIQMPAGSTARYFITNYCPLSADGAARYANLMRKAFYSEAVDGVPVFSIIRQDGASTTPAR